MKLQLLHVGPTRTLSLAAESDAEEHQLRALERELQAAQAEARLANNTPVTIALSLQPATQIPEPKP